MKYDFDLDLSSNTSTGKMIEAIDSGSQILEFGPGNGRMTHYLVHEKKCEVDIVEFDQELYDHVMTFARSGFLGDIESFGWEQTFDQKTYDYIIFADVLEHLRDPETVLTRTLPFLKETGKILISFPNITHNSVLIDLFNNKLEWKKYGLLDKTHLSFYAEEGFKEWFTNCGLSIEKQDYTYSKVGENELSARYSDLPDFTQYAFKNRLFGEVYQYFFVLSKEEKTSEILVPENSHFVYEIHCQYQVAGELTTEKILVNNHTGENKTFTLAIPKEAEFLKIFPILKKIDSMISFRLKINDTPYSQFETNADWNQDDSFIFYHGVQPLFELEGKHVAGKEISVEIDYLFSGDFPEIMRTFLRDIQQKEKEIKKQRDKLSDMEVAYEQKIDLICSRYNEVVKSPSWEIGKKKFDQKATDLKTRNEYIDLTIESIEYDEESDRSFIRGWGLSKQSYTPLFYRLQSDEAPYYQVTKQYRPDVNDHFEIDRDKKLGFLIEIDHPLSQDVFHLSVQTKENDHFYLTINRFNLSEAPLTKRMRRILGSIRRNGISGTLKEYKARKNNRSLYDDWIERNEQFDVEKIQEEIEQFKEKPLISIVVPVYNVEEKWLGKCVQSMEEQFYPNWELCLADDCSPESHVRPLLEEYAEQNPKIKVVFREKNGHISAATNSAIEVASGDYIGFMDNDDELAPNALYEVVKAINEDQDIEFIYTDEDKINTRDQRFDPFFKPTWNSELLLGHNYITHFVVVKKALLDRIGYLRSEFDGSQDYDFVLRATEQAAKIHHIPKILYHWRTVETSVAYDPQSKEYAYIAGQNAVQESLNRRQIEAEVRMTKNYGCYKTTYTLKNQPKVSVLIHGDSPNIKQTIFALLEKTNYHNFEILTSASDISVDDERLRITSKKTLKEMIAEAEGRYFVTLRAGLIPKNSMWLDELVNYGHRQEVGIVGGKIVNEQDVVFNAGITYDSFTDHLIYDQRGISNKGLGYYFRISLPREIYAVTEDCLFIKKSVYEKIEGIPENLPEELTGLDLCLQVRNQTDKKVVWEPYTVFVDLDGADEKLTEESLTALKAIWTEEQLLDPYRNPNNLER